MKKVTLLGDSIRISYGAKVRSSLGNDFVVYQPEDNCRFSKYTLRLLVDLKAEIYGSDIIHWNNGLWDTINILGDGPFTPEEEYVENMLRMASELKKRAKVVIFATTTPVTEQNPLNNNTIIKRYNDVLVPKLEEMGIIINDLYSLVYPHIDEYIRKEDNIHLTERGVKACAEQVAKCIIVASDMLDETE